MLRSEDLSSELRVLQDVLDASDIERADVVCSPKNERHIRNAINQYLARIPHHGAGGFGSHCRIFRIAKIHQYAITTTACIESRSVVRKRVPYAGWDIPPLRRNENNADPWSYSLPTPGWNDSLASRSKIVADSQQVCDCADCLAEGVVDCDRCQAAGLVACAACSGAGAIQCAACNARGTITKIRREQYQEKCPDCTANTILNVLAVFDSNPYTRVRTCRTCRGTGVRITVNEKPVSVKCGQCKGATKIRCTACSGKGVVQCKDCHGRKKVRCSECNGRKRVVSYLELIQEFRQSDYTTIVTPDELAVRLVRSGNQGMEFEWNEVVAGITAERFDLDLLQVPKGSTGKMGASLVGAIQKAFHKTRADVSDGDKLYGEHIQINRASVLVPEYGDGNVKYAAIFAVPLGGQQEELLSHYSVATGALKLLMQDANRLAAEGEEREAALQLKMCREMAEVDHVCKEMFTKAADEVPEEVLRKSEKILFSGGRLVYLWAAVGAVITGLFVAVIFASALPFVAGCLAGAVLVACGFTFFNR